MIDQEPFSGLLYTERCDACRTVVQRSVEPLESSRLVAVSVWERHPWRGKRLCKACDKKPEVIASAEHPSMPINGVLCAAWVDDDFDPGRDPGTGFCLPEAPPKASWFEGSHPASRIRPMPMCLNLTAGSKRALLMQRRDHYYVPRPSIGCYLFDDHSRVVVLFPHTPRTPWRMVREIRPVRDLAQSLVERDYGSVVAERMTAFEDAAEVTFSIPGDLLQ